MHSKRGDGSEQPNGHIATAIQALRSRVSASPCVCVAGSRICLPETTTVVIVAFLKKMFASIDPDSAYYGQMNRASIPVRAPDFLVATEQVSWASDRRLTILIKPSE